MGKRNPDSARVNIIAVKKGHPVGFTENIITDDGNKWPGIIFGVPNFYNAAPKGLFFGPGSLQEARKAQEVLSRIILQLQKENDSE